MNPEPDAGPCLLSCNDLCTVIVGLKKLAWRSSAYICKRTTETGCPCARQASNLNDRAVPDRSCRMRLQNSGPQKVLMQKASSCLPDRRSPDLLRSSPTRADLMLGTWGTGFLFLDEYRTISGRCPLRFRAPSAVSAALDFRGSTALGNASRPSECSLQGPNFSIA